MKRSSMFSASLSLLIFACSVSGQVVFKANLDQAQAGGTGSTATGTAILCLNPTIPTLRIFINFNGLSVANITGCHIDRGAPPVVFGLVNPFHDVNNLAVAGNGFTSIWDPADVANGAQPLSTQIASLQAGNLSFNVITPGFPTGEIRGQITPVLFGDINLDGVKSLFDVPAFVTLISTGGYQIEADFNKDGVVNLLDIPRFVIAISAGC